MNSYEAWLILFLAVTALVMFSVSLICSLIPCWIIAYRRGVAGRWWYWILPLWNVYYAAKIGRVPRVPAVILVLLLFFLTIALEFGFEIPDVMNGVFFGVVIVFFLSFFLLYVWFMHIGELAGVHRHLLPQVMIVLPALVMLLGESLFYAGLITDVTQGIMGAAVSVGTWIFFFVVALRTPRVEEEVEFVLSKK